MSAEVNLLAVDRGSVTAPAGCGKTQVIADALARHAGPKPILVLTHTNAGVMALRRRLDRAGVPPKAYRLSTLDGWAMRLVITFPGRSGHDPAILELRDARRDYPAIRKAAAWLLHAGHLNDVLAATYDRLLVDEYQDCLEMQHAIVRTASLSLRTCVLGDPLQAVFGFAGRLADWQADVRTHFPHVAELSTPWRWINAGEPAFGEWLLWVRGELLSGTPIHLTRAPPNVIHVPLTGGGDDDRRRMLACRYDAPAPGGGVLIIAGSMDVDGQRRYARVTPGAVAVESVDLRDLVEFARGFNLEAPGALAHLGAFADKVLSGADGIGLAVRAASPAVGATTAKDVEKAAAAFVASPSYRGAVDVLVELGKQSGVRSYRPAVLACCIKAMNTCADRSHAAFVDAALRAREDNRLLGRPLPARAVGSTLLLKGLEAEVSVLLDVEGMDAANLYVAMTRGSKRLVICSRSPLLTCR